MHVGIMSFSLNDSHNNGCTRGFIRRVVTLCSPLRYRLGIISVQKERSHDGRHMMGRQSEHVILNEIHGFCSLWVMQILALTMICKSGNANFALTQKSSTDCFVCAPGVMCAVFQQRRRLGRMILGGLVPYSKSCDRRLGRLCHGSTAASCQ